MNIYTLDRSPIALMGLMIAVLFSGSIAAQFPNPDAAVLFSRSSVSGTAASTGAGGAFSSVGGDLGCIELNPAGLGLYKSNDICITPGLKISADQSNYDGNNANTHQVSPEIAQAGATFTKKLSKGPLKSFTFALNYEGGNFFSRNQNFNAYNTTNSLIDNYVYVYNHSQGIPPIASLDAALLYSANILGYNPSTNAFNSNIKTPVQQSGYINTRGFSSKLSIGFGANISDKLYLGLSVSVPILNYTVNTQMTETNPNPTDSNNLQYYTLNPSVSETGAGFTGTLGLIYQPTSWMRIGMSYGLPTWLFLNENSNSTLSASFDSIGSGYIPTQYNPAFTYRLRLPMKGVVGASFYFAENSFFSADYSLQNVGSTHYSVPNDTFQLASFYNSYMKSTYTFTHTVKAGIQGAYKKLRLRAGYSYITSPFKSGQNYMLQYSSQYSSYNQSVQTATAGIGLVFKRFYVDMSYIFTYTKDGLSPGYQFLQVPLDEIRSTYMTHSILLTVGVRIPAKGDKNSPSTPAKKQRSSDQLPRYIDPGDKY
jgi:hypothetical protein